MTAVDHAELKRLAEGAKERAALLRRLAALSEVADALDAMAGGTLSALSEIEGLEAELEATKINEGIWFDIAHDLRTQAPDSWRPIETAPKDGTVIDVWRDYGERDTVFWGLPHHDCGEMGQHCDSDWHSIRAPGWVCNTFNEFVGRNHNPFTHWMPLPAAPTLRPQTAESGT